MVLPHSIRLSLRLEPPVCWVGTGATSDFRVILRGFELRTSNKLNELLSGDFPA